MPESSCLVGSWLVGRKNPMQVVMSETVALAEDGCLRVTAYEDGYVILPGTRSGAGLPRTGPPCWTRSSAGKVSCGSGANPVRRPPSAVPGSASRSFRRA